MTPLLDLSPSETTTGTPSDTNSTRQLMQKLIQEQGEWTAMNIHLGGGVYTRGPGTGDPRLQRLLQLAIDTSSRPIHELRVLDLACLEGQYGIEFALQGARRVVGIEGRDVSIAKAEFARQALGLNNIEFFCDDVRHLSREKYGSFDVVICSGILYHLDAPDVFEFIRSIASVCEGVAIFDTYISTADVNSYPWNGKEYWGRDYREHAVGASAEEKNKDLWASLENMKSVWLTKPSLFNVLADVGFTSVLECAVPTPHETLDRVTLVAIKKQGRAAVLSSPPTDQAAPLFWSEHRSPEVHPAQNWKIQFRRKLSRLIPVPRSWKEGIKRGLRAVGLMKPDTTPKFLKSKPDQK